MGVSKNRGGPPKSWILIGFSIINHPFWGTTIFENTQIIFLQRWGYDRNSIFPCILVSDHQTSMLWVALPPQRSWCLPALGSLPQFFDLVRSIVTGPVRLAIPLLTNTPLHCGQASKVFGNSIMQFGQSLVDWHASGKSSFKKTGQQKHCSPMILPGGLLPQAIPTGRAHPPVVSVFRWDAGRCDGDRRSQLCCNAAFSCRHDTSPIWFSALQSFHPFPDHELFESICRACSWWFVEVLDLRGHIGKLLRQLLWQFAPEDLPGTKKERIVFPPSFFRGFC